MTPEVLQGLLWLARVGSRARNEAVLAGHGYVDPSYRPPQLPYVSVTGPLDLKVEAEREPARKRFVFVQTPGYLAGAQRTGAHPVPGVGQLHLRLDGTARTSLALNLTGTGATFADTATGDAVAARLQTALSAAGWTDDAGAPIADPARLAELAQATARWDAFRRRLVVASGRRGAQSSVEAALPSSVEVLPGPGDLAPALGLDAPAVHTAGRLVRHEVPAPTPIGLDVRIDLWARSQSQLAVMSDTWARLVPTRAELGVRPGVLAVDAEEDATEVRLQSPGEPATPWSLVHLEASVVDRIEGNELDLAGGVVLADGAFRLAGSQTAELGFYRLPPVPSTLFDEHPGREGYGLSLGVRTTPGAAAGDSVRLVTVQHDGRVALRLSLSWMDDGGELRVELTGTAELQQGGVFATAQSGWRLLPDRFDEGAVVHAVVDGATGLVRLFVDGRAQPLSDDEATPAAPVQAPGRPAGGTGMTLVLGDPDGADVSWSCDHLHLHGEPLGPVDPRLRVSAARGSAFSVGDPVVLMSTKDGVRGSGRSFTASVTEVDGDRLVLDRPLGERFAAGSTLVCKRRLFFSQNQIRRRDDLMNRIYRLSLEYRVSALLEERLGDLSVPLVETTEVIVRDLTRLQLEQALEAGAEPESPPRPGQGAPGSASADAPPSTTPSEATEPA